MIKPDSDRLDYGELLCPPPGYSLNTAVGTTYALNLEVLLGVPLALASNGLLNETDQVNGVMLLDAIRKYASKISLFCEAGNIAVPDEARQVLAFLEDSINQVVPKKGTSFHPKIWVAEYQPDEGKEKNIYRVIVLSRNLTFDRSWDLAVVLEGQQTESVVEANQPLIAFLNYLSSHQKRSPHRKAVQAIAEQIERVAFKPQLKGRKYFYNYEFLPLGISDLYSTKELMEQTCHNITIISPFISKKAIGQFKSCLLSKSKMTLISRREELNKLGANYLEGIECWHLKDMIVDGEGMLEEEDLERSKQDIHARLYLKTKDSWSQLWVGSANCTDSALALKGPKQDNVEFMLKLDCYFYQLHGEMLLKALMGDKEEENPFERWQWDGQEPEPDDPKETQAKILLNQIIRVTGKALVVPSDKADEQFNIALSFSKELQIPDHLTVEIAPLMLPNLAAPFEKDIVFQGVRLANLCLLYSIWIRWAEGSLSFVLKIPTDGIPEHRDDAIFKSIIGNREGFFQYVAFLLGDDAVLTLAELLNKESSTSWIRRYTHEYRPILFEKMLKAAAQHPERLYELKSIIESLAGAKDECGVEIIPEEFVELFNTFEQAAGLKRKRRI